MKTLSGGQGINGGGQGGFSFLEVLATLAVVGVLAALATQGLSLVTEEVTQNKLEKDVTTLNRNILVYRANGGSLDGVTDAQDVLDKLKTARTAASDDTYVGLGGAVIDARLQAVPQRAAEAASAKPRALWNAGDQKFEIATTGEGVAAFVLSENLGTVDYGTEARDEGLYAFNDSDGWVWDYDGAPSARTPLAPTAIPLSGTASTGSTPTGPGTWPSSGPATLLPPSFSQPGGGYLPSEFPLTVTIDNSANPSSTWVTYSINGGAFQTYAGPFSMSPGDNLLAYAAGDPVLWSASGQRSGVYEASAPTQLLAPVITLSDPAFAWGTVETIEVVLTDPNPSGSEVYYALGGGAWQPYAAPFDLAATAHPGGVTVEARSVASFADFDDSSTATASVGAPPSLSFAFSMSVSTAAP